MSDDEIRVPTGDLGRLYEVAAALGTVGDDAETLRRTVSALDGRTGPAVWRGPAADAFRQLLAEVGPELTRLTTAHHTARDAVRTYAGVLGRAQSDAAWAKADADRARADRETARQEHSRAHTEAITYRAAAEQAERATKDADSLRAGSVDPVFLGQVDSYQADCSRQAADARDRQHQAASREADAAGKVTAAGAVITAKQALAHQAQELVKNAARTATHQLDGAAAPARSHRNVISRMFHKVDDTLRDWTASPEWQRWTNILSDAGDVMIAVGRLTAPLGPVGAAVGGGLILAGAVAKVAPTAVAALYGHANGSQVLGAVADAGLSVAGAKVIKGGVKGGTVVRDMYKGRKAIKEGRAAAATEDAATATKRTAAAEEDTFANDGWQAGKGIRDGFKQGVNAGKGMNNLVNDARSDDPQPRHTDGTETPKVAGKAVGATVAGIVAAAGGSEAAPEVGDAVAQGVTKLGKVMSQ